MNAEAEMPIMPTEQDRINARVAATLTEPPAASPRQSAGVDMDVFRARQDEAAAELRAFAACLARHFGCPQLARHDHARVRLRPMLQELQELVRQLPAG